MKLSRRDFIAISAASIAAGILPESLAGGSSGRPNVLFIMADDLGYGDLSCFGRPDYRTPVLDKLASEGIILTRTYANSAVCSPTRTALLTGRYQYRLPVGLEEPLGRNIVGVSGEDPTIASEFKTAGYQTALVGKWHLGAPPDFGPIKNGYDHFFGFYPGGVDYFAHNILHGKEKLKLPVKRDGLWEDDLKPVQAEGYLTDVIADRTQDYLKQFSQADKPFFLSLHFSAPHWPWEGPNDIRLSRDLTNVVDLDGGNAAIYAEMVKSLDANIGRVLKTLKKLKLDKNTVVVFTSDNGGERFSFNWPLIGQKGELLEGGIRVPGIVRWPGRIKPGSKSEQVITSMDWMPTLLAAAGIPQPPDFPLDGMNLLPVLTGKNEEVTRKLFWRYKANEQVAVLDGNWKYLKLAEKEFLFDLATDQRERANLKNKHPKIFERLKKEFAVWNADMLPYTDDTFSYDVKNLYSDRY